MTYNASICPTDHATPDPCDISPRMRPRLGTMIGPGPGAGPGPGPIQKPQPWRPVRSEQPQTTGVGLQHVTQRRRERLLDWPQFRLRRKFTSTTENGVKRWNADSLSETGPHRHPMKAIHPGLSSDCSQCPTIITGSVATGINAAVRVQSNKTETVETSGTRRRRGISTNPHVRRRFSADGMPLHGDDLTDPSPAKRIYDVHGHRTIHHGNSMDTLPLDRSACPDCSILGEDNLTLVRIPTWHPGPIVDGDEDVDKRLVKRADLDQSDTASRIHIPRERHSVGTVQRSVKSESHILTSGKPSSSSAAAASAAGRRKSHLLSGLRRSARQTLDTLCKALRSSTTNLADPTKYDRPSTTTPRRHSDMALNQLCSHREFDRPSNELSSSQESSLDRSVIIPSCPSYPIKQATRLVELKRNSLHDPFGIFVIRSELGFRVTRVSDSQMDTSPGLKELHVGDELIQVNGMQCARLSLMELTQHFSKCLILLLTVRSITTEPQRS